MSLLGPLVTGTPTGTPNCTINVELRRPDGTYRAPVVRAYPSPQTQQEEGEISFGWLLGWGRGGR